MLRSGAKRMKGRIMNPHSFEYLFFKDLVPEQFRSLLDEVLRQPNETPNPEASEIIRGSTDDDRIDGDDGNNIIRAGTGDDKVDAKDGDDTINGGPGNDALEGDDGADIFLYEGSDEGHDTIKDFDRDEGDRIAFANPEETGVSSFGDLSVLSNDDGDAVISWGENSITLEDVDADEVSADDFIFAASAPGASQPPQAPMGDGQNDPQRLDTPEGLFDDDPGGDDGMGNNTEPGPGDGLLSGPGFGDIPGVFDADPGGDDGRGNNTEPGPGDGQFSALVPAPPSLSAPPTGERPFDDDAGGDDGMGNNLEPGPGDGQFFRFAPPPLPGESTEVDFAAGPDDSF